MVYYGQLIDGGFGDMSKNIGDAMVDGARSSSRLRPQALDSAGAKRQWLGMPAIAKIQSPDR